MSIGRMLVQSGNPASAALRFTDRRKDQMKRRLASILVADVAGYSSLMEADEEGTAARMAACRSIADAAIAKADGRLFKAMGDALLVEFASPLNSVRAQPASVTRWLWPNRVKTRR